eukprot:449223_1
MSKFATLLIVWIVIVGTTTASIAESPNSDGIERDDYQLGFTDYLRESSADVLPGLYLTPNQVVHSIDTVLGGLDMMELWHHKELLESDVDLEVMDARRNNYIDSILTWVDHQVAKSNALGGLSPEEKKELDDGVTEVLEFLQKKFTERNETIDRFAGDENSFSGMQPKKLLLENFLENHKSGEMKIAWLKASIAESPNSDGIERDDYQLGFTDYLRESSADVLPGLYLTPNQVVHSIDTVLGGLDMMELWHH